MIYKQTLQRERLIMAFISLNKTLIMKKFLLVLVVSIGLGSCSFMDHLTLMEIQDGSQCYKVQVNTYTGAHEIKPVPCRTTSFIGEE